MKIVIQRVSQASVTVENQQVAAIGPGLLLLVGIHTEDTEPVLAVMAAKVAALRIFEDENSRMNLSLVDVGGQVLAVSQFTLLADCRKGRRPNFMQAAPAEIARAFFEKFVDELRQQAPRLDVQTGVFQATMDVHLVNQGPVTIVLDSGEICPVSAKGHRSPTGSG